MSNIPLLADITVILSLSIVVLLIFEKLKLPAIIGFILTGIIAGPHALSLVTEYEAVESLAEIGVILLLFSIGVEFSLKELLKLRRSILFAGLLQVVLTIIATTAITYFLGFAIGQALFLGFLFSLSSTAIVLKMLQDSRAVESPHGRSALSILIIQDILVVPMMLVTPLLAVKAFYTNSPILAVSSKGVLISVFALISARYLVPTLLNLIVKSKSQEVFLFTIVVICFTIAALTRQMGLSLSLGAFFAGLIISESQHSHQVTNNIKPFNGLFTSIFFVSIGMLFNLDFFLKHYIFILGITFVVILVKTSLTFLSLLVSKPSFRTLIIVALTVSQVGEFSFVLAHTGLENNLLNNEIYQYFLSVSIITMVLSPILSSAAYYICDKLHERPLNEIDLLESHSEIGLKDHIVIIGFGLAGRNIASALKHEEIPYVIIELNYDTVLSESSKGEPIYYGDALDPKIVHKVNVKDSKAVIVAISDYYASQKIVSKLRAYNSRINIVARAKYFLDKEILNKLGANEVVIEECEASRELLFRVLDMYFIDIDKIRSYQSNIMDTY